MAQEIGIAYVTVAPSAKGFGKAVEGEIDKGTKGASKSAGGRLKSLAGSVIKWGTAAVVGVGAAITGLAIKGGIDRALNIEDAQAKLRGLGHDTKSVETIMTDALASVKGTAFGLDAAATTAAAAVASGIKPGKELEGYLRLTADAATIAGVSMEEMGSIINKVQAKGKAQMEDLNRLTERGIPILQMLADEYGVTAEEMSDMVSRGEVDAERFRKALEDNVGGAALESGNTTRGAFANMRAAMSRWGLALVGDGLGAAKTFFQEVTVIFDGLTERMTPWVERIQSKLGEMFQIEGMGDRFLDWFDRTVDAIANGPIPKLLEALAPILPVVGEAARLIGSALGEAFFELGEALAPDIPEIAQALSDAVVELAPALTDLLVELIPLIPSMVKLLAAVLPLAAALLTVLLPAVELMVDAFTPALGAVSALLDYLSGETSLSEFATEVNGLGGPMLDFAWIVIDVVTTARKWLYGLSLFFQTAIVTIATALHGIRSTFSAVWSAIVSAVASAVGRVVSTASAIPGRIMSALSGAAGWLVQTGRDIVQGLINGVSSMIQNAVSAVQNVGGAMLDGVKSFLGIASPSRRFRDEVGKMVGLGLLEGIEDSAIRGRIDTAVNHLVGVPELAGAGLPGSITLLDADGSILTRARVIAGDAVVGADRAGRASLRSGSTDRRF